MNDSNSKQEAAARVSLPRTGGVEPRGARRTAVALFTAQMILVILPGYFLASWFLDPLPAAGYLALLGVWVAGAFCWMLVHRGRVLVAGVLALLACWSCVVWLMLSLGIHAGHAGAFAPVIVASGLLLSHRWTIAVTAASCLVVVLTALLHRVGFYGPSAPLFPDAVSPVVQLLATGGFMAGLMVSLGHSQKRHAEQQQQLEVSQAQLRRAEKMDAFGQLAGGVAHDFNNILTGMLGHIDLLRMQVDGSPEAKELSPDLDALERSAERAASITGQLLAFSRKESSDHGASSIARALEEADVMLRSLVREDVEFRVLSDIGGHVALSPASLDQVLMNLVINASDAMSGGGALFVSSAEVLVEDATEMTTGILAPGRYVLLTVSDSGQGIQEEVLERVFEPFFTTKEAGRGTGLGLSTVLGIVQRGGGEIDVESRRAVGTTFRVYLPRADEPSPPEGLSRSIAPEAAGPGIVLVCEDDATILNVLRQVLGNAGYDVRVTEHPEEALALGKVLGKEISLLITDVIMPGMNGRQLASALEDVLPGLPVLFISGYTAGLLEDLGLEWNDPRLLSKPFTPKALLRRVSETMAPPSSR